MSIQDVLCATPRTLVHKRIELGKHRVRIPVLVFLPVKKRRSIDSERSMEIGESLRQVAGGKYHSRVPDQSVGPGRRKSSWRSWVRQNLRQGLVW